MQKKISHCFNKSHSLQVWWQSPSAGRQSTEIQCCRFIRGSREHHSSMVKVFRRVSAFMIHCSQDSFPAGRIYPVFSKFDSPGINGWGTMLSASQTHSVEWLPRSALPPWLALYRARVLGRRPGLLQLLIFLPWLSLLLGLFWCRRLFALFCKSSASLFFFPSRPHF